MDEFTVSEICVSINQTPFNDVCDDDGKIIGKDDTYKQTKKALQNIEDALRETDASLVDVVRTRMFVTDIDEWGRLVRPMVKCLVTFAQPPVWLR